jgi:hypothetical protein
VVALGKDDEGVAGEAQLGGKPCWACGGSLDSPVLNCWMLVASCCSRHPHGEEGSGADNPGMPEIGLEFEGYRGASQVL